MTIGWIAVGLTGVSAIVIGSSWGVPWLGSVGFALFVVAFFRFWFSIIAQWFERVGGTRWRVPGALAFSIPVVFAVGAELARRAGLSVVSNRLDDLADVMVRVVGLGAFSLFAWRFVQAIQRQRRADGRGKSVK